jgi:hypothetical protein
MPQFMTMAMAAVKAVPPLDVEPRQASGLPKPARAMPP